MTALDFISAALRRIGVLAEGDTASDAEGATGLEALNNMVDQWAAQKLLIWASPRALFTLTSGVGSYTIGSGGAFNTVRPEKILDAGVLPTAGSDFEIPVTVLTDEAYAAEPLKSLESAFPTRIYFDRAWVAGLGTIYTLPTPNVAGVRLALYLPTGRVAQFADLTTDYTFPPGYKKAIAENLEIELAEEYGKTVTERKQRSAQRAIGLLKRANYQPRTLQLDAAVSARRGRGGYDWRTGDSV